MASTPAAAAAAAASERASARGTQRLREHEACERTIGSGAKCLSPPRSKSGQKMKLGEHVARWLNHEECHLRALTSTRLACSGHRKDGVNPVSATTVLVRAVRPARSGAIIAGRRRRLPADAQLRSPPSLVDSWLSLAVPWALGATRGRRWCDLHGRPLRWEPLGVVPPGGPLTLSPYSTE